ncbi:L,D-transpeptidase [Aestuariibius sp. HNIBRBA575]|uniref:L,D-transpeptidase n=1 Tax=Aestuariibius sp. HNIBRBA575 TaxID=3233343 RepID=UPI0034A26142
MLFSSSLRVVMFAGLLAGLNACATLDSDDAPQNGDSPAEYGLIEDGGYTIPAVPAQFLQGVNRRALVDYPGDLGPGVIEIDPHAKFLYLIQDDGMAMRYPIAVGRAGRGLRFPTVIRIKREWPSWTPTANMLRTQPEQYGDFAAGIPGGPVSPLGARALYLFSGSRDTHFRIHGTNDLRVIGNSGSAGCIRLFNQDVIDLYDRVENGTRVVIRSYEDSVRIEGEELANRGEELPPLDVDSDVIFAAIEAQLASSETTESAADSDDEAEG